MTARRTDANQREIVDTFRKMGASVQILSDIGKGCPDLVVGIRGINYLVEVKDGSKAPSKQRLTEPEQVFFDTWKGQVCIIKNQDEAVRLIASRV
jgi:Holliday junction resolvase